jgi:hypothetical protein
METGQKPMEITSNLHKNITNLELSIQISLSGLSFCILNKATNTFEALKTHWFEKSLNPLETLDKLKALFTNDTTLNQDFDKVTIIHDNDLSTLVPESLFNENHLADYLKFNSKILKSDFIAFDTLSANHSVNVYVPYVNINNYIYDKFGDFIFKHASSVLIQSILQIEQDSGEHKMYVNVNYNHFEIVVLDKSKLVFYNTFVYNSEEDFIYYILFTAEQLQLDPETLNLVFIGDIAENDKLYNIAYKYIRNISFGSRNNNFKYLEAPKSNYSNFILLNSL